MKDQRVCLQHFVGHIAKEVGQHIGRGDAAGQHAGDRRQVFGALDQLLQHRRILAGHGLEQKAPCRRQPPTGVDVGADLQQREHLLGLHQVIHQVFVQLACLQRDNTFVQVLDAQILYDGQQPHAAQRAGHFFGADRRGGVPLRVGDVATQPAIAVRLDDHLLQWPVAFHLDGDTLLHLEQGAKQGGGGQAVAQRRRGDRRRLVAARCLQGDLVNAAGHGQHAGLSRQRAHNMVVAGSVCHRFFPPVREGRAGANVTPPPACHRAGWPGTRARGRHRIEWQPWRSRRCRRSG